MTEEFLVTVLKQRKAAKENNGTFRFPRSLMICKNY